MHPSCVFVKFVASFCGLYLLGFRLPKMKTRSLFLAVLAVHVLGFPNPTRGADVGFFGIIKSSEFVQTNSGAPLGRAAAGFAFNAFVLANADNVVTGATVKPSNATALRALLAIDPGKATWRFEERFDTQAALDGLFPNGNILAPVRYTNTMLTVNDGTKSVALDFVAASLLGSPPTPQITNFVQAQAIDTTTRFRLGWTLPGGTALDLVQVIITDTASNGVFSSAAPFAAGALNGTSNSIVLPPNSLPPGTNLVGHLSIVRIGLPNTNGYAGATGIPGLLRDTEFRLATRPAPAPPRLTVISTDAAPFQFRYTGESNRVYHVQGTEDFVSWTDLLVTNLSSAVYTDQRSDLFPWRFYRVQVGP